MEDLAATHPVFMLKHARAVEKEQIAQFELRFDRMYDKGHVWARRMNGYFRLGIDDFTRKLLGRIEDIRLPQVNTSVKSGDPIWIIYGNGRTLHMYTPIEGKLIDFNPDIIVNPNLISIDPYDRGWISTFEPVDLLQASNALLAGRSAKEWLQNVAERFYDLVHEETGIHLNPESPIPEDFARLIHENVWKKLDKNFFMPKEPRK
ncbi:MAG: glycine cleavage system protein H [Pseudomonadota bacterium]